MSLELPDWNEALKFELDQPTSSEAGGAQVQLAGRTQGVGRVRGVQGAVGAAQRYWKSEDQGVGLRVEGLDSLPNVLDAEYWIRKAATEEQAGNLKAAIEVLKEALNRDVRPVTDVLRTLQDLQRRVLKGQDEYELSNDGEVASTTAPTGHFTPSKTGLTGKALRVPSRFARTPGITKTAAEQGEPAVAADTVAPKTLTSVLKRLTFSAAKPALKTGTWAAAVGSTTPGLSKQTSRHVSFGAGTISPAARPAARRQSNVHFQTPQPTIEEGEAMDSPAPSQVNSVNAGQTPFDSRLSGLFRKYIMSETPSIPSMADVSLDEVLAGKSPSWRALSGSISVSDSIKGLTKKYNSDLDSILGLSSPELSPLAATPLQQASAVNSCTDSGASPALAPTPHHLLEGWQRNGLYESPSQHAAKAEGQSLVPAEVTAEEQAPGGAAAIQQSSLSEKCAAPAQPLLQGLISPFSGAIHLSTQAPVFNQTAAEHSVTMATASDENGGGSPMEELTPGVDGVPRDSSGVPLYTPATVTVTRGLRNKASFRDDGVASNLFGSAESPEFVAGEEFSFTANDTEGDTPNLQLRESSEDLGKADLESSPVNVLPLAPSPVHDQQSSEPCTDSETVSTMPRSTIKSQHQAMDQTPLFGKAQRVPSPTKVPRGSTTKELRMLMSGLTLESQGLQSMGTLPVLTPVRSFGHLKAQLGVDTVVTPVRRSTRFHGTHAPVQEVLEQTNYSYVPNDALLPETAKPDKATTMKRTTSKVDQEQAAPNVSLSTRNSSKSVVGLDEHTVMAPAAEETPLPLTGHRYSLRRNSMRTPTPSATTMHKAEGGMTELHTPATKSAGPQVPVPQDGSPALQESPVYGVSYTSSLRRSARKPGRHSTPGPSPFATASTPQPEPSSQHTGRRKSMAAATPNTVSLSPTEQGIRTALRRSARKSSVAREA